jgi:hypothetical protein
MSRRSPPVLPAPELFALVSLGRVASEPREAPPAPWVVLEAPLAPGFPPVAGPVWA